jgi:Fe-S-cluster containining protein
MSYLTLLGELDAWFARGVAEAGPGVVLCTRGCSACCFGPFDISPADAQMVAGAVDGLNPAVGAAVRERAAEQLARYTAIAETWTTPWDVDDIGDDAFDRLTDALADLPCPALNAEGSCLIYQHRPATCRMTGLSMETRERAVIANVCPILHTSAPYAELAATPFDLLQFEATADDFDDTAMAAGWGRTTVAGAIGR